MSIIGVFTSFSSLNLVNTKIHDNAILMPLFETFSNKGMVLQYSSLI